MGELIQLGDFKKKSSKPKKEILEQSVENGNAPYAKINEPKEDLINRIKKSLSKQNKETILQAQEYFNGWTNVEIANFINNTNESTIKTKPVFFVYAYNKMKSRDSMIRLAKEYVKPIKGHKDSREEFFEDFFK